MILYEFQYLFQIIKISIIRISISIIMVNFSVTINLINLKINDIINRRTISFYWSF